DRALLLPLDREHARLPLRGCRRQGLGSAHGTEGLVGRQGLQRISALLRRSVLRHLTKHVRRQDAKDRVSMRGALVHIRSPQKYSHLLLVTGDAFTSQSFPSIESNAYQAKAR